MRITKKIELIKKLTEEIERLYDKTDQERFFNAFNVNIIVDPDDWVYIDVKNTLHSVNNIVLKGIAEELGIGTEHIIITPPKNWEKSNDVKAFISHTSKYKNNAKNLSDALKAYNIDCFVAHEDIRPSEEWEREIDKALQVMDFFISLHTEDFAESSWCQQEVGYAVARNIKIIPIKYDGKQDPCGFIGKIQALAVKGKTIKMVTDEIKEILKTDKRTKSLYEEIINPNNLIPKDEEVPF